MASGGGSSGSAEDLASGGPDEYHDYFSEINDIESANDEQGGDTDDELSKTPDEGEQEKTWLKEVGFEKLVSKFEEGKDITEAVLQKETSTLTDQQAATVKRRVETLKATRRSKMRSGGPTDVRDVFADDGAVVRARNTSSNEAQRPVSDLPVQLRHNAHAQQRRQRGEMSLSATGPGNFGSSAMMTSSGSSVISGGRKVTVVRLPSRGGYDMTGVEGISIHTVDEDAAGPRGTLYLPRSRQGDPNPYTGAPGERPETKNIPIKPSSIDKKDGLPHFITEPDEQGSTHISDVSSSDCQRIQKLCLIELTAMFDLHSLTWARRRSRRRNKESGVFGVPLQTLYEQDIKKYQYIKVPLFFDQLIDHLERCSVEEEGILRVPGSVSRIKQLRQEIEESFQATGKFSWDAVLPNDGAGLLKQLLRDLPVPLLTFEYLDAFRQIDKVQDSSRKQQLQALNLLVLLLPDVHRNVLQMLLRFLKKVVDCTANKMTLNNVAMIMAPNLFCVERKNSKTKNTNIQLDMLMASGMSNVVRMLIKYQHILWTVPSFIIAQVRRQIETETNRKSKDRNSQWNFMKYFGKKEKVPTKKERLTSDGDVSEGVIRVQAPHLSKDSTKVQVEPDMTAKDIVVRFYHAQMASSKRAAALNGRSESEEALNADDPFFLCTHLHEVGGNIGERKLQHDVRMSAMLRVNPNAQWIVKTTSKDT